MLASCSSPPPAGWVDFISEADGTPRVFRIGTDGHGLTPLAPGGASYPYGGDAQASLLVRDDDIVVAGAGGLRSLAPADGLDWYPRLSPDGRFVLFESSRASFRDLYRVPFAGGAAVRLTDDPAGCFDGAWSPDGAQIVFACSTAGQLDLYVMAADGAGRRRLTAHPGDSVRPRWAASDLVVFVSGRDGTDGLFAVPAAGGEVVRLDDARGRVERFDLAGDGAHVAYAVRAADGTSAIWTVVLADGSRRRLSREGHDDREPAWSPRGRHLAFTNTSGGTPNIWIMRADGSHRSRLTDDPEAAWLPRWVALTPRRKAP